MTRLALALLGPVQIMLAGQPVGGITYNKARALPAYLAVEAGRSHQRDALAALLWPDMPDEAARHNLRQALANLRTAIGDASATPPFLHITRDSIQFNTGSDDDLDVAAFTALLAACAIHAHRRLERCRSCAARMEQALSLYHGDFLAGFSVGDSAPFEEWQLQQRERLHQQALDALVRLADYHERRGDDELARRYAQRQIELDPWREEAHRQLMRLLARGNQRSAALAQYETCRRILARDLGVEPEAETTALYERIRDGASSKLRVLSFELPTPVRETQNSKLKTQNSRNFPAQTTLLIGRESELAELGARLENPACRLITITGPGGIGKTRLALAAAAEQAETFTHGAAFVSLAAINSAAFVAPAILAALDIPLQGQREPRDQLFAYLREKHMLLVLDNLEQLLAPDQSENDGSADLLSAILARAPGITLLVTSRERLALPGEWLFDLSGLSYPTGKLTKDVESYSAGQLFMQRAGQVRRQFALVDGEARAVARICRLVEGLPLAIELAAATLRTRSCTAIAEAIEISMSALTSELRAIPERQRSIWATFEHSWRLLSDEERQVFPRLSVFRGGFTLEAAVAVCRAQETGNREQENSDMAAASLSPVPSTLLPVLAALVDKSLLRWDGAARYDLHELVRQYAGEKLEQVGQTDAICQQHATYHLIMAEAAASQIRGAEQPAWLKRLELEHDNLRAALRWSLECGDGELSLRLGAALSSFWRMRGHLSEGRRWLEDALAANNNSSAVVCAPALLAAAWLAHDQMDNPRAYALAQESLALCSAVDDNLGIAKALHFFGMAAGYEGDNQQGCALLKESLAFYQAVGERAGISEVLCALAACRREHVSRLHTRSGG